MSLRRHLGSTAVLAALVAAGFVTQVVLAGSAAPSAKPVPTNPAPPSGSCTDAPSTVESCVRMKFCAWS